jgi:hypothetical protein
MKRVKFNKTKDDLLFKSRGIRFKNVIDAIKNRQILDLIENPNKKKFPNQKMYIVEVLQKVYVVPFVENGKSIFLKTIYLSRKYRKKYKK